MTTQRNVCLSTLCHHYMTLALRWVQHIILCLFQLENMFTLYMLFTFSNDLLHCLHINNFFFKYAAKLFFFFKYTVKLFFSNTLLNYVFKYAAELFFSNALLNYVFKYAAKLFFLR
jgi:hypothetical protein